MEVAPPPSSHVLDGPWPPPGETTNDVEQSAIWQSSPPNHYLVTTLSLELTIRVAKDLYRTSMGFQRCHNDSGVSNHPGVWDTQGFCTCGLSSFDSSCSLHRTSKLSSQQHQPTRCLCKMLGSAMPGRKGKLHQSSCFSCSGWSLVSSQPTRARFWAALDQLQSLSGVNLLHIKCFAWFCTPFPNCFLLLVLRHHPRSHARKFAAYPSKRLNPA